MARMTAFAIARGQLSSHVSELQGIRIAKNDSCKLVYSSLCLLRAENRALDSVGGWVSVTSGQKQDACFGWPARI